MYMIAVSLFVMLIFQQRIKRGRDEVIGEEPPDVSCAILALLII